MSKILVTGSADGTQTKSYLYINDCIEAMLLGTEKSKKQVEICNVGSQDQITVKEIAEIITEEMGLKNVKFTYTCGIDGRGCKSDVKNMLLDTGKIKTLGWMALSKGYILLTRDYDFANTILFPPKQFHGIIVLHIARAQRTVPTPISPSPVPRN